MTNEQIIKANEASIKNYLGNESEAWLVGMYNEINEAIKNGDSKEDICEIAAREECDFEYEWLQENLEG